MTGAALLSFLGAILGASIGGTVTIVVGEGKRRRDEDNATLAWATQIYDWVTDGRVSPKAAHGMLEARRVRMRRWPYNKRYARIMDQTITGILDGLDNSFLASAGLGSEDTVELVLSTEAHS